MFRFAMTIYGTLELIAISKNAKKHYVKYSYVLMFSRVNLPLLKNNFISKKARFTEIKRAFF